MRYINYFNQDAYTNIAMDAWLLRNLKLNEPIFALWQNKRAIIVGENQNTFSEVNEDYVKAHDIQVVRRVSGGGAVVLPSVSGLQTDPGAGEGSLLWTFAAFHGKFFHQCTEFYLAWIPLSE